MFTLCVCRLKARVATVDEALTDCKKQLQAAKLSYDQLLDKQTQLHRCRSHKLFGPDLHYMYHIVVKITRFVVPALPSSAVCIPCYCIPNP